MQSLSFKGSSVIKGTARRGQSAAPRSRPQAGGSCAGTEGGRRGRVSPRTPGFAARTAPAGGGAGAPSSGSYLGAGVAGRPAAVTLARAALRLRVGSGAALRVAGGAAPAASAPAAAGLAGRHGGSAVGLRGPGAASPRGPGGEERKAK